ncbi:TIGR03435 family protein [Granulicella sp. 5B5]|uniref:TIGR03435 family protein n=1 Tax=Granulicella sp. 5B5 TaxID=1617967 RepID=UPI0015F58973|nr:TIGR03435 family protein [Granulicella sp. 5B5]QMV18993.1 TIGR03435 family protein [Granulicella sp. 5B5]
MRAQPAHSPPARYAESIALLLAMAAAALHQPRIAAQSPVPDTKVPAYDVVSIKPNNTGSGSVNVSIGDGNFDAANISLKTLILEAYSLKESQLSGLPKWNDSARFDIRAKIIAPDKKLLKSLTRAQSRSMLQPILTDRFQLKFHRDWKIEPIYDLVITKGGPKFSATTAAESTSDTGVNGVKAGGFSVRNGSLTATGVPVSTLVDYLPSQLQRVVIDKTGLTGKYNLQLKWARDDAPPSTDSDAPPDIFTALKEQLGLELKPSKASIETFVIDHVEMPSEN